MDAKAELIVHYLAKSTTEYVTSRELGYYLGCSTRTVIRCIQEIHGTCGENGYEINSKKGHGYHLTVIDQEAFQKCLFGIAHAKRRDGLSKLECQVARQLLLSDAIKLDDLASQFHYSRSSMSRIIAAISSVFDWYHLKLESKAHYGLFASGNEILLRDCINYLFFRELTIQQASAILGIEHTTMNLVRTAIAMETRLEDESDSLREFMICFMISANRIRSGHFVNFDHIGETECKFVFTMEVKVVSGLLQIVFPEMDQNAAFRWEILYLTLEWEHTFSAVRKKMHDYGPERVKFFMSIVKKSMHNIRDHYGVDFTKDTQLMEEIAEHISSFYGDYLLSIERNPDYLDEVRSKYPAAYYYSIEVAACIHEHTKMKIPDDKLAMLALHFAAAIEEDRYIRKVKIILVGQMRFGAVSLLESRIRKLFDNIDIVAVSSLDDIDHNGRYTDLYITTIPIDRTQIFGKPVICLSPFLNESDCRLLNEFIENYTERPVIEKYFQKKHFYIFENPGKKKQLLNEICDRLIREGSISLKEKEDIFSRETLVSTEIAPRIAMPHCIIHGESFLVFSILMKPVVWDQNKIHIVILGCFQEGDLQMKQLLKLIYKVILNNHQVDRMIRCRTYEEFMEVTKEFMEKEYAEKYFN